MQGKLLMRRNSFLLVIFFLVAPNLFSQIPQTLNYQGILTDTEGTPVTDGRVTMRFVLYESPDQGTNIWQETHDDMTVQNGVFQVMLGQHNPLDLPFDKPYYLGISVNGGTELLPRIELTASAFSLRANSVTDSSVTGQSIASGQVVRSLKIGPINDMYPVVTDDVTLKFGSGLVLDAEGGPDGGFFLSAISDGHSLNAPGNSPRDALIVDSDGNIGIGLAQPASKLAVAGTIESTQGGIKFPDGSVQRSAMARSNDNHSLDAEDGEPVDALSVDNQGNVGIGTSSPTSRLHLQNNESQIGFKLKAGRSWTAELRQTDKSILSLINGGTERVSITPEGRVGISRTTPSERLHVFDPDGKSAIHLGGPGTSGPHGVVFDDDTENAGVQLFWRTSSNQLVLENSSAGTTSNAKDLFIYDKDSETFYFSGDVGLGTKSPTEKLDVRGNATIAGNVTASGNATVQGKMSRPSTGSANLVPICYGSVDLRGTINTGTGNFSVRWRNNGEYEITIEGHSINYEDYIIQVTAEGPPKLVGYSTTSGRLFITMRNTLGVGVDSDFSFIVYRP
jgi:hypothetical protein